MISSCGEKTHSNKGLPGKADKSCRKYGGKNISEK